MPSKTKAPYRRSPSYPSLDLEEAVNAARTLYQAVKRNKVRANDAITEMGFKHTTSQGQRALAALGHYGIINSEGLGEQREVWLSERGLDIIVMTEESEAYQRALFLAAVSPESHQWAYKKWPHGLPASDSIIKSSLVRELDFNESAIDFFIKELRKTFEYSKIGNYKWVGTQEESTPQAETPTSTPVTATATAIQTYSNVITTRSTPDVIAYIKQYPIPLVNQPDAVLSVPLPLSKKNIALIIQWLNLMEESLTQVPEQKNDNSEKTQTPQEG
jgi:hypothetical protein